MLDNNVDIQLTNNIQKNINVEESLSALIDRHSGIFLDMVNSYIPSDSPICDKKEVIDELPYYVYKASKKYDNKKGTKFSTFLGNETRYMCLNLYNRNKKHLCLSPEEELTEKELACTPFEEFFSKELVNKAFSVIETFPDKRISKIFSIRYLDSSTNKLTSWKVVGEKIGLSIQGCINIHDEALTRIKESLENSLEKDLNLSSI